MPRSEDWRRVSFKIENWGIASVKRKKSAEKQTRELGPRKRFTLPAKLSKYIRSEDTPMWYKFYAIISPGKRSIFQERNVSWLEASNFSHHSLNRSNKNQIGHTAAVVCQWIQAVNKFCWIDAVKGSQIAFLVSPAVFFLSNGNENCSLTSGKSVNFWVDFLFLKCECIFEKENQMCILHHLNLLQKDFEAKIKCWKFAGADTLIMTTKKQ